MGATASRVVVERPPASFRRNLSVYVVDLLLSRQYAKLLEIPSIVKKEASTVVCVRLEDGKPRYMLPIHVACAMDDVPLGIIELLAKAHPSGVLEHTTAHRKKTVTGSDSFSVVSKTTMSSGSGSGQSMASATSAEEEPIWGVGWLPIHVASYYGVSTEVLRFLIREAPASVFFKTTQGLLPIHIACVATGSSSHHIPVLVEEFPQSIYVATSDGVLPHDILEAQGVEEHHELLTVAKKPSRSLLSSSQKRSVHSIPSAESSLKLKKSKSMLFQHSKLFKALSTRQWTYSINRLQRRPHEARIWTLSAQPDDPPCHMLPLHVAIRRKAPFEVVQALLNAYPESKWKREFYSMLPLHLACETGAKLEIVQLLAEANTVRDTCMHKMLPLHLVCASNACRRDVIEFLLALHPKAMNTRDGTGFLPLDYVENGGHPHFPLIKKMFERGVAFWSAKAAETNQLVSLILKADWAGVKTRIQSQPEECTMWTEYRGLRYLPLHYACIVKAPLDVVEDIIGQHSFATSLACQKFDMLPLHLSVMSPRLVELLLKSHKYAASVPDSHGLLPLHLACTQGAPSASIEALVAAFPEAAASQCVKGYTPLEYAQAQPNSQRVLQLLEVHQ